MGNSTLWADVDSTTPYSVYLGIWTNWSRGRVMGATLTTTRQYGNLFIAFTAFFVGFVASRFWKMACLACHRYYSSTKQEDALHHQRQAVLRNSSSSFEGLVMFIRLAWTWRSSARRCLTRMIPSILTATFLLASFSIAGGFSSQISSAIGSDVLLDGSDCGVIDTARVFLPEQTMHAGSIFYSDMAKKIGEAANYAQQCYSSSNSGMLDCTSFIVDHVSSTMDTQAPCPFPGKDMCRLQTSNLRLDTGLLDSNEFLGLNSPKSQRIFFRNVLECAPLVTESFSQDISTPINNYTVYKYGPNTAGLNYTYQVETLASQYNRQDDNLFRTTGANFLLSTFTSIPETGSTNSAVSDFVPIPELYTDDGALHLIFLQGKGVLFYENTTDPWYQGTQQGPLLAMNGGPNSTQTSYQSAEAASPMACVEKYQFCNADKDCGPLTGMISVLSQSASLFNLTISDLSENLVGSRFYWYYLVLATMSNGLDVMLESLGPRALQSQQSLYQGVMGSLPDDQWHHDVIFWWAARLAGIQAAFVNTAYDSNSAALNDFRIRPWNSHVQDMCNNQKIKSTDYTSFSLFGLYFTYITGLLIIMASFTIEPVIAWLYRRNLARKLKRGEYRYLEWVSNGTLQLQRFAYQGIKSGTWSGHTDDIPVTEAGALLGSLTQSYWEVPQDQKLDHGSSGDTLHAATLQAVTIAPADRPSEAVRRSSDASAAAPALVPDAGDSNTVPRPHSNSGNEIWGGYGRGLHHQALNPIPTPGSVTPASGLQPVSPVSPLPTEFEPPALLPRNATLGTNMV